MSRKQFLSSAICAALMGGLLVTCDWPQATPTPAPPISSPTSASPTPPSVLLTPEPLPTTGPEIVSHDFSDFTHFSFAQESESGPLCPDIGIFVAEISRSPHGDYLLKASIAEYGTLGVDQCLEGGDKPRRCTAIVQLPERTLTPAEVDAVLDTFREIEIVSYDYPPIECDASCHVLHFTWDSFDIWYRGPHCYFRNLGHEQVQELEDLLSQLTTRSRAGLPTTTPP